MRAKIGASSKYLPARSRVTGFGDCWSPKRMETLKAEMAEFQSAKDLKTILGAEGPCLSVYVPLSTAPPNQSAKANALEWKETLRILGRRLHKNAAARRPSEGIGVW